MKTLLGILLCCQPFIIRRADVPDEKYLELGSRFPAVAAIGRIGDATLVTPRWLVTAAHVARGAIRNGVRDIRLGERQYEIDEIVVHPDWRELGPHDIALIRLREAVSGIAPIPLHRRTAEAGLVATLVGHGGNGTGDTRARSEDGRRRGATSRVDSVSANWLYFSFDAPPAGTALEGAPGPGDSGGPAILTIDGVPALAGVSSAGFDGRAGPGTYGAIDVFTRVSTHLAWIDSVMAGARARR